MKDRLSYLMLLLYKPCKIKRSPSRYTTTPKRDKIPQKSQKSVSAYCWFVYSSRL